MAVSICYYSTCWRHSWFLLLLVYRCSLVSAAWIYAVFIGGGLINSSMKWSANLCNCSTKVLIFVPFLFINVLACLYLPDNFVVMLYSSFIMLLWLATSCACLPSFFVNLLLFLLTLDRTSLFEWESCLLTLCDSCWRSPFSSIFDYIIGWYPMFMLWFLHSNRFLASLGQYTDAMQRIVPPAPLRTLATHAISRRHESN